MDSYDRVLICSLLTEETLDHLFFHCPFTTACWNIIDFQIPHLAMALFLWSFSNSKTKDLSSWKYSIHSSVLEYLDGKKSPHL